MPLIAALLNILLFCLPAALAGLISAQLTRTSREEWVLLAWVPPLPLLVFGLYVGVAVARDPTAANLWPFVMVCCAALTAALFGLFLLGRRFLQEPPNEDRQARFRPKPPRRPST